MYNLSKKALLFDLYKAFECAKKHKTNKFYIKKFEENLHNNLVELCDELYERRYKPLPSVCFIVEDPKKREIFAANFRDRIVHHLYFNYTYNMFNSLFIEDSYSCRVGKGTHYGIDRLNSHIKKVTQNYTKEAYALKMDIKGYFIHIDRLLLLKIVDNILDKMRYRLISNDIVKRRYCDVIDIDFVKYLGKCIIMLDPTENCVIKSPREKWLGLDKSKSLFNTEENCGLPIGNLTSQLFSNVYMNILDQYIKRELKCKHYGRYVDDFYVLNNNKEVLKELIPKIEDFLKRKLHLDVQKKKTHVINMKYGIEFLGAFIRYYRKYLSNETLKRIRKNLHLFPLMRNKKKVECMINSYLGIFFHFNSLLLRKYEMFLTHYLRKYGFFNLYFTKFETFLK